MIFISLGKVTYKEAKLLVRKHKNIEFRMDLLNFSNSEIQDLIKTAKKVVITFKNKISIAKLENILTYNPDFIDIDYFWPEKLKKEILSKIKKINKQNELNEIDKNVLKTNLKAKKIKTILSYHNYEKTPLNLNLIIKNAKKYKTDIIKLACKVDSYKDNLRLLNLVESNRIIIGMGERGIFTRVMALKMGSFATFCAISGKNKVEKSQITKEKLLFLMDII